MPEARIPPRVTAEARTDRSMAHYRDVRAAITASPDPGSTLQADLADGLAQCLAAEFPDLPLPRLLASVSKCLGAIAAALDIKGIGFSPGLLVAITGLAAEQLDREGARDGG